MAKFIRPSGEAAVDITVSTRSNFDRVEPRIILNVTFGDKDHFDIEIDQYSALLLSQSISIAAHQLADQQHGYALAQAQDKAFAPESNVPLPSASSLLWEVKEVVAELKYRMATTLAQGLMPCNEDVGKLEELKHYLRMLED